MSDIDYDDLAVRLTVKEAESIVEHGHNVNGGLESEYADWAMDKLQKSTNNAWLDMREGFISDEKYDEIKERNDYAMQVIYEAI